jgi:predicted PurR-regulated permease PerM
MSRQNAIKPTPPPAPLGPHEPLGEEPSVRGPLDVRSIALTVIAVLGVIVTLRYAEAMIIPIVLGILISYALDPVVIRLTALKIPRPIAAAMVILLLVGAAGALAVRLRPQVDAIVQDLPDAARRLRRTLEDNRRGAPSTLKQVQEAAKELEKAAQAAAPDGPPEPNVTRVEVTAPAVRVSDYVMWGSINAVAALGQLVLVLFLAYFLLASGDLYRRKLVKIAGPSLSKKRVTVQILEEIDRQIASFLMVQVFTSVVVGVATWLAFRWIGLEQAAVWGLLAGLFNSIPYFGPVIVTSGTAVVAFLQFGELEQAFTAAAAAFAITSLEGLLLTPWLTSRAARMNAVAVFVGLLFFGWVWDVWGMLLAVPMLMVIKAICDRIDDFKPVGELLGD